MIEIYTRNFDLHITVPSPNLAFLCRNLDYKPYSINQSIHNLLFASITGGSQESQDTLAKTGRFMMSLGHQLQDDSHDDEDDREALRKRVAAVAMHRQKKIDAAKDGKKSGIWNLLSCGGGLHKCVDEGREGGLEE